MTSSTTFRTLSAALLAAALGFAAVTGCGKPAPTPAEKKDEPKVDPKPEPKKVEPEPKKVEPTPGGPPTLMSKVEPAAEQAAMTFLKDLGQGTATADALSARFLKSVGKPVEPLPDDLKNGYSRDNATRWLKRVGENCGFNPPLDLKQAGEAIYWRGPVTGPGKAGGYSLRLVKDAGAWKVDWLGLSTVEMKAGAPAGTADAAFQEFAVAAFAEVLTDAGAMSDETRPPALAHTMTADLRKAWAAPGGQDTAQGYDYSPGNLRFAAVRYGGGTSALGVTKAGDLTFNVVLTKPAGPKTIVVKLVKGTAPGEWLVSEVTEPKG